MILRRPITVALVALLSTPLQAQTQSDLLAPETASDISSSGLVTAESQMVVVANPLAAEAGLAALQSGGTAADAALAVQAVLGLVEPQSSGLGGGAFALWYDAATAKVTSFDARETAPTAVDGDLFLDEDGEPLDFFDAVVGGRSVGVPGVPMLLQELHDRFGGLERSDVLAPAVELAREGFKVSPRLATLLEAERGRLDGDPAARRLFFDRDGAPLASGTILRNPAYADALQHFVEDGARPFYAGPLAEAVSRAVRRHPTNPGSLSVADLAAYEVKERDSVCRPYRGFEVCGMGPPSSGGIAVAQILGLIEPFDIATLGPDDPQSWRLIGDATRLAFADRGLYLADPDFVRIPEGLLADSYLADRSRLLRRENALDQAEVRPGEPPWRRTELRIEGVSPEQPSTSHFVIADRFGNVLSMTSSIENAFGSRIMANGYLLNNQLTDFSFLPEEDRHAVANRVEPGKRPRSSMAPTIILENGKPVLALGSPGGASIIPYVARTIVAILDWRMPLDAAIALPHRVNMFGPYMLEQGTPAEDLAEDLKALGYEIRSGDQTSGLHVLRLTNGLIEGAADPRREGVAIGD